MLVYSVSKDQDENGVFEMDDEWWKHKSYTEYEGGKREFNIAIAIN